MAKSYRPYFPEQDFLLPPSLREWLAEDHLAYFVSDLIDELDLGAIESHYEREERGQPPYHPRMMTKVLVYGYCVGVFSSRRLEKRLAEDIGFRGSGGGQSAGLPHHIRFPQYSSEDTGGAFRAGTEDRFGGRSDEDGVGWRWTGRRSRRTPASIRR